MNVRRHGWQRPLHPLQIVGMAVFTFLAAAYYIFLGLFLGNRIAEITMTSIFSFVVLSAVFLFVRCTAIDPTDKTSSRKKKKRGRSISKLNYGFILGQIVLRFFRRIERKILRSVIRRQYLDPWKAHNAQVEQPLLPFPLLIKEDLLTPDLNEDDISFCILCDLEVKKHSKHCRTCNRCVEGFDHHCRWLNNCIGKRNYTTFILLMVSVLFMVSFMSANFISVGKLMIEAGTAVAVFVRCFADTRGMEHELVQKLHFKFPIGLLATIAVVLFLFTSYSSAALGQLFFFHVVLIRKGMRTYDFILAMKEENETMGLNQFDDFDTDSDESSDFDSPEKPSFVSRFMCRGQRSSQDPMKLSIRIDADPEPTPPANKQNLHVSINPWSLLKVSKDKALAAAERAREKLLLKHKSELEIDPLNLKPLPSEKKRGPLMEIDPNAAPVITKPMFLASPGRFSSPRRRFSGSSGMFPSISPSPKQKYRTNFDLKLTEVSKELEMHISKQVLCSMMRKDGSESSPR